MPCMIIIAASLYLPEHIATVASRAWFYYAGDDLAPTAPRAHEQKGVTTKHTPRMDGGEAVKLLGNY